MLIEYLGIHLKCVDLLSAFTQTLPIPQVITNTISVCTDLLVAYIRVAVYLTPCRTLAMEDTKVQPHQWKINKEADLGHESTSILYTDVFGL